MLVRLWIKKIDMYFYRLAGHLVVILLLTISNVNADLQKKRSTTKPLIIVLMGIPSSGKSTIAAELANLIEGEAYLEDEEEKYPSYVKEGFKHRDRKGVAIQLYWYFRNIRVEHLMAAITRKYDGKSTILDSFFDKLFYDMLGRKGVDWIVDPKHVDFHSIKKIAYEDKNNLPDVDVIIFLNISKDLHKKFYNSRNRKSDVDNRVFIAQNVFQEVCYKYAREKNKILLIVEQKNDIQKVIKEIVSNLESLKIIQSKKSH